MRTQVAYQGPPREHFTRQSRTLCRFARASRAISCSALDPAPEAASPVFLRATAPAPPGLAARYVPRRPPPARFAARVGIASPLHAAPSNAARGPRAALRPTRCATSRHAGSVAAACRAPHVACDAYGPDVCWRIAVFYQHINMDPSGRIAAATALGATERSHREEEERGAGRTVCARGARPRAGRHA